MELKKHYMEVKDMNTKSDHFITPEEYEKLQHNYNCTTEYLNGEIVLSSNTSSKHNSIVVNLATYLNLYFKGSKCRVHTEGMEVIFGDKDKYKLKPDVFVVCQDDIDKMKGQSFTTPPKIIFEVISKSTAGYDRVTKLQLYRKYGVREYNMVEQDGAILQCILKDGEYIPKTYRSTDQYISSVFPDLKIDLKEIF